MRQYIYLIGILLITLALAIAIADSRLRTLSDDLQESFDKFEQERISQ